MKRLKRFKTWIVKDHICRQSYANKEINKLILKSLLSNHKIDKSDKDNQQTAARIYWTHLFNKYGKYSSLGYQRKGCQFSGTGRSVFTQFKGSRHHVKNLAVNGFLPGMRKASF